MAFMECQDIGGFEESDFRMATNAVLKHAC
jgi:hypothetical protein